MKGDGKKELVLCGVNDVDEKTTGPGSVIAVLDPKKIVGETESSTTRGFGFDATDCELYYILVPQTDMSLVLESRLVVLSLESEKESVLRFSAHGEKGDDDEQFEFDFSKDLRILDIKPGTWNSTLHDKLKKEGKLSSVFNDQYIEDMKNRIKYWNGQKWVKEHVMVDHSLPVSKEK